MTGLFGLLLSLFVFEKGEGPIERMRGRPVAGDMSKPSRDDTASILRRCRGAYRAKSEFLTEANLARINMGEWLDQVEASHAWCNSNLWMVGGWVGGWCVHVPIASHRRA